MKMNPALIPYLKLMRFPAVFTAWSNIIAAAIIGLNGNFSWFSLIVLIFSTSFLYLGGMILNDWFDYETDCKERKDRPLPIGDIPVQHALFLGAGFLVIGTCFAAILGTLQLIIALCIVLMVLFYNGLAKNTLLGIKAMASCRYLNWLLALSINDLSVIDLIIPVPIALFIMAITLLSQDEERAENSSVVNLVMILVGSVFAAIACLIAVDIFSFVGSLIFVGAAVIFVLKKLHQLKSNYTPHEIQKTMGVLITCIIPLDALMLLANEQTGWAIIVLALLIPAKKIGKWIYMT